MIAADGSVSHPEPFFEGLFQIQDFDASYLAGHLQRAWTIALGRVSQDCCGTGQECLGEGTTAIHW